MATRAKFFHFFKEYSRFTQMNKSCHSLTEGVIAQKNGPPQFRSLDELYTINQGETSKNNESEEYRGE